MQTSSYGIWLGEAGIPNYAFCSSYGDFLNTEIGYIDLRVYYVILQTLLTEKNKSENNLGYLLNVRVYNTQQSLVRFQPLYYYRAAALRCKPGRGSMAIDIQGCTQFAVCVFAALQHLCSKSDSYRGPKN